MNALLRSIEAEYRRYKALADAAIAQVDEPRLAEAGPAGGNSIAVICWHLSGNLQSRFTDFLSTDGEKPWRKRDDEFLKRSVSRVELTAQWNAGWQALLTALAALTDYDLTKTVRIRGQPVLVHEALHRSLAHTSYHVGQIVYLSKIICGANWRYLSIPPGGSAAYNTKPECEKPDAHVRALEL